MPSSRAHDSIGCVIFFSFFCIPFGFVQHTIQCKYNSCSSDSDRKIITLYTSTKILMLAPGWSLHQFQRCPSNSRLLENFIKLWKHLLFICVSMNSQQQETVNLVLIIFWGCREREVFQKCVSCRLLFQERQKARGNENILHCILQWF